MQRNDRKLLMSIMRSRLSAELTRCLRVQLQRHFTLLCIFCLVHSFTIQYMVNVSKNECVWTALGNIAYFEWYKKNIENWFGRSDWDVLQKKVLIGFHKVDDCSLVDVFFKLLLVWFLFYLLFTEMFYLYEQSQLKGLVCNHFKLWSVFVAVNVSKQLWIVYQNVSKS